MMSKDALGSLRISATIWGYPSYPMLFEISRDIRYSRDCIYGRDSRDDIDGRIERDGRYKE